MQSVDDLQLDSEGMVDLRYHTTPPTLKLRAPEGSLHEHAARRPNSTSFLPTAADAQMGASIPPRRVGMKLGGLPVVA